MQMIYPFTEEEMNKASESWNCNCGPSALAFALQVPLESVRHSIPGFAEKGYTSPTMMKAALVNLRGGVNPYVTASPAIDNMFRDVPALVRVQWTGPWTKPGANPKWAYRQTHWICCWLSDVFESDRQRHRLVFDCNGGIASFDDWQSNIVPIILKECVPRNDGGWLPTHIWRLSTARLSPAPSVSGTTTTYPETSDALVPHSS